MLALSKTILGAITIIFLIIVLFVGFVSWTESKRRIDKLRYSFLTIGSLISLIFAMNV